MSEKVDIGLREKDMRDRVVRMRKKKKRDREVNGESDDLIEREK